MEGKAGAIMVEDAMVAMLDCSSILDLCCALISRVPRTLKMNGK